MRLVQLPMPITRPWVFVHGEMCVRVGNRATFATRQDAVDAARQDGLRIDPNGAVHPVDELDEVSP